MATHFYPRSDGKAPIVYINSQRLIKYATIAQEILANFKDLAVWKVQCKDPSYMNNAWYVGLVTHEKPFLMNFTITSGNLNIEFRFSQYLGIKNLDRLKWQTKNWRRIDINSFSQQEIYDVISTYIINITPIVLLQTIRSGGRSFVEDILFADIKKLFPNELVEKNKRLNELRSDKNRPLEFDIYIPGINVAIEVQGPQHFRNIYGDNSRLVECDIMKRNWCVTNKICLIWINWEEYNARLLKKTQAERLRVLVGLLREKKCEEYFISWPASIEK